jgi:hypothetical protein
MMSNKPLLTPSMDPANVLDLVSMIGAWSLSSRARARYIMYPRSRVYIANQFGESITSVELLTVNGFHRLSFPDEGTKWFTNRQLLVVQFEATSPTSPIRDIVSDDQIYHHAEKSLSIGWITYPTMTPHFSVS